MFKKLTLGVLGIAVLGGLLFGSRIVPYANTAYVKVTEAAQSQVPIAFQIDSAKAQLKNIDPEIKNMIHQIAKETVQVKKLAADIERQSENLERSREQMITLRDHVESGDKFYVGTNSKAYSTERVTQDLRQRFAIHKTAKATVEKDEKVLELRKQALTSAFQKLEEAQAQKRELAIQIEHLTAQHRMNEVVKTASKLDDMDDSQLARTRGMIEDIAAQLATEEEMLNMTPTYFGQIPVDADAMEVDSDILGEMDAYFDAQDSDGETVDLDDEEFASIQ